LDLNRLQKVILEEIGKGETFKRLRKAVLEGATGEKIRISGLGGSSLAAVITSLSSLTSRPICIVTSKRDRSEQLFDDLEFFSASRIFHFPAWEILPYEPEEPHMEIAARQLETFDVLAGMNRGEKYVSGGAPVIVTPIEALFQKIPSPDYYDKQCIRLSWGDAVDTEDLARRLVEAGFTRMPVVECRGEFSIRGGIVDIFPLTETSPVRLDLFGREIDSIRFFDAFTQRSEKVSETIEGMTIVPARLTELTGKSLEAGVSLVSFLSCLDKKTILLLDEPDAFESQSHHFEEILERQYFDASARGGDHTPPDYLYTDWSELANASAGFTVVTHSALPAPDAGERDLRFLAPNFQDVTPSLDYYTDLLQRKQREDFLINVVCDNEGQVQRFDELLREREISAVEFYPEKEESGGWRPRTVEGGTRDIVLSVGNLHEGFLYPEAGLLFVTDREIFGRYKRRHIYRKMYRGTPISAPSEIKRGDYVVHVDHGIGKFLGIRTQFIDGRNVDLVELIYADNAKLLVPVDKIRNIQKYSMVDNVAPPLDVLGSKRWMARKKKTSEKIEHMARELLQLYARREIAHKDSCSPDTVWQSEFESSFIYEETPDQLTAIHQVKHDLESGKPMDRLVCGDVGYGKTEVALRAAFKMVQEGRQVAVLAPTTILCQQHYNTFSERFAEYPFQVEMLSRFKTRGQQTKILQKVKNGEVHILVGTHRLLSKDVAFSKLGLVIVDEEQRFGVRHKERLKELRSSVDLLTLTATPIPRTLYMALSGLRDLSIINTPPPNRLPIKTRIIHWDDEMIREAILREINRGGQIFFVHNRILNIQQLAGRLVEILPDLRIAIAHGRLNEHELEKVMLDFIDRKYDLLLSTTIIENGLDIPNVNTIVINRADAFGLAQLYQLRGRVGRDVKRAYAYLITPSGQAITDAAVRRLSAIEEFTELGVGFNIAMRDLEIRGSGNLLGKEQHGCIVSIGFDLYCSLLEKTVSRLKGEPIAEERPVEIKWAVEGYLPADYIPMESQRVGFYKRLSEAGSRDETAEIRDELRDRYGNLPDPVENLLKIAELRILASTSGLKSVILTLDGFKLRSHENREILSLSDCIHQAKKSMRESFEVRVPDGDTLQIRFPSWGKQDQLSKAISLLDRCGSIKSGENLQVKEA